MNETEVTLIMAAIESLRTDYKEAHEKLEASTGSALTSISRKVDDFISGHPTACFFLAWRKGRWRKVVRAGIVIGIAAALPPFVLGLVDLYTRFFPQGGHP